MTVFDVQLALDYMNITDEAKADEVEAFLASAEAAVAIRVGPLLHEEVSSRVTGSTLVLPLRPVVSVETLADRYGTDLTVADYDATSAPGLIYPGAYACLPSSTYTVGYTVGYAATAEEVPADLRAAVLELTRHLYLSQRGPTKRPGAPQGDSLANSLPGAAYSLPIRVEQLLAPYIAPRIA